MIVSDPLLRSQELTAAKEALAQVGLHLGSWKDLRDARPEYAAAVPVLLEYVSRCRESLAICELIWAVACQRPDVEVMRRLVNLARRYMPPSFDLWTQWHNYRKLRNQEDARGQRAAEYAIQSCWYLSYERPKKRGPVRAFDLGFPDEDTLKLIASNDVVSMGLGNALTWTACPELFEDVAELLRDTRLRFGRELLPTALAKCDPSRAPDVLIGLVNDVDIGAHAMVELGRLAHEPARPYIEKFLEHPIDWVRREAKKALRRLDQAAGRRAATAAPFDEVLPASERARGAKLVAGTGAKPRDIEGKVSAFVIGSLAEDERGWTRENCFATSVELDELESLFGKLAQKFNGDFRGSRGRALREEMFEAEHEDWRAYKLNVRIGERAEEIWLHYVLDDPATVDVTIWGPTDFIAKLREVLSEG